MTTTMLFDLKGVTAVAPALSRARLSLLFSIVPGMADGPGKVKPEGAFYLWLADFLARHSELPADQQGLVLVELAAAILDLGRRLWAELSKYEAGERPPRLPGLHLIVWDRRYVSLSGHPGLLDLREARQIDKLPRAALLVESCDLTTLFTRNRAKMVRNQDRQAKGASDAGRTRPD